MDYAETMLFVALDSGNHGERCGRRGGCEFALYNGRRVATPPAPHFTYTVYFSALIISPSLLFYPLLQTICSSIPFVSFILMKKDIDIRSTPSLNR